MNPNKSILHLIDEWNKALQTHNPDEVLKLYDEKAVLLPTFSCKVRHNPEEIRDYFVHFLEKGPVCSVEEANIHKFGNTAMISGIYTFTYQAEPTVIQQARFTFVYHKTGDRWLIVEHHSSCMPVDE
jgi:uncharacterized protein (TIGR02246 family)